MVATSTTVVDSHDAAWVEAGDIILAVQDGVSREQAIDADLSMLLNHPDLVVPGRPRLFKSVGQGWCDVVVARLAALRLGLIEESSVA